MALKPGTPCVVVLSGGLPVKESPANYGATFTPASNGFGVPVRIADFGQPITFVGEDGELWPGGEEPSDYSDEAAALFARMSSQPNDTRKGHIDTLIVALKTAGVWAKLDALYVLAAADSQAALLNWVSTSFNATLASTPTFTTDRGFTNNGTTAYVETGYTPSTAAGLLTQNNAHFSVWSRTGTAAAAASTDAGSTPTAGLTIAVRSDEDNFIIRGNATTTTSLAHADGSGHFIVNRTTNTHQQGFRNGAQVGADGAVNSSGLAAGSIRIGGRSTTNREWAAGSIGSGLTAQNITDFYTALNTYMTAVGAA